MKLCSYPLSQFVCFFIKLKFIKYFFNRFKSIILISSLIVSCQSKNLSSNPEKNVPLATASDGGIGSQELTINTSDLEKQSRTQPLGAVIFQSGKMKDLRLSDDESQLIYAASDRRAHSTFQIYSLDLTRFRERRLTFNDGQNLKPLLIGKSDLLYSSTTDSIKERPLLFYKEQAEVPSNIYLSDLVKGDIERLTRESSQDSLIPNSHYKGQVLLARIASSVSTASDTQVFNLNLKTNLETKISSVPGGTPLLSYSVSDKLWFWLFRLNQTNLLRFSKDLNFKNSFQELPIPFEKVLSIQSYKNSQLLLTVQGSLLPPKAIVNSAKQQESTSKKDQSYYVLLIDFSQKCVRKILQSLQPIECPQATLDLKNLYYIRHENNQSAIVVKQLQDAQFPCEEL